MLPKETFIFSVSISDWALSYEGSVCLRIREPSCCLAAYYKSSFPYRLIKLVFLNKLNNMEKEETVKTRKHESCEHKPGVTHIGPKSR